MYVSEVVEEAVRRGYVDTCDSASIDGFLSGSWCVYRFMWACDLDIGQSLLCIPCLSVKPVLIFYTYSVEFILCIM